VYAAQVEHGKAHCLSHCMVSRDELFIALPMEMTPAGIQPRRRRNPYNTLLVPLGLSDVDDGDTIAASRQYIPHKPQQTTDSASEHRCFAAIDSISAAGLPRRNRSALFHRVPAIDF
jgi:hypothetical protein